MVILLITSLVFLAFLAVVAYFWQKPASPTEPDALGPAPEWPGSFINGIQDDKVSAENDPEAIAANLLQRSELLDRAKTGDKCALQQARDIGNSDHSGLYDQVLNSLVESADSRPKLLALISYVTRQELPVNNNLAESFIDSCKSAPDRSSATKMLHLAALSNDAAVYQTAVETALELWRGGDLSEVSPQELRAILEGEFWILSSATRSSGAGFLLKRALAVARRELEAAHND